MQFFLIYVALPCLFYRLIADKPLDQLANWPFIAATTLSTLCAFGLSFASGWRHTKDLPQTVMQGVAGSYSNIGYMGPPLILAALGPAISASYLHLELPTALNQIVTWLYGSAAPCALFLLGVTVAMRPMGRIPGEVPALVLIKLVLHPLLLWAVLSALGDFGRTWTYA